MGGFLEAFYRFGALKGGVNLSDAAKVELLTLAQHQFVAEVKKQGRLAL
jgi:hypothetical protein